MHARCAVHRPPSINTYFMCPPIKSSIFQSTLPSFNLAIIGLLFYSPVQSFSATPPFSSAPTARAAAAASASSATTPSTAIRTRSIFSGLSPSASVKGIPFSSGDSHHLAKMTKPSNTPNILCASTSTSIKSTIQYIDAGTNLLDSMYTGTYHSKPYHDADLHLVLQRAYKNGIDKLICLAGSIEESKRLLELMDSLENNKMAMGGTILDNDGVNKGRIENIAGNDGTVQVFGTVGVHPTRTAEVFADKIPTSSTDDEGEEGGKSFVWRLKSQEQQDEIIQQLIDLVDTKNHKNNNIVAIGECGLDYARLVYAPREIQLVGLRAQLQVARATGLPLYLHNRESGQELYQVLLEHMNDLSSRDDDRSRSATDQDQQTQVRLRGIVHSFDEDIDIANLFLSLGLYIGINGCSLKTPHNLHVVQQLPLDRLILETDCPWCDIRPTHASYQYVQTTFPTLKEKQYSRESEKEKYCVKNRTEPCHVVQVAEVIAALHGVDVQEVALACRQNVLDLFENIEKRRWCFVQP